MTAELLSRDNLLKYVSEEEIFGLFLKEVSLARRVCNDARGDQSPGCNFFIGDDGRLIFHDPSCKEWTGDCFHVAQKAWGLPFLETLKRINAELNVGLYDGYNRPSMTRAPIERVVRVRPEKTPTLIRVRTCDFTRLDKIYWSRHGVSLELLEEYQVHRAEKVWLKHGLWYQYNFYHPAYVYVLGDAVKVYMPALGGWTKRFVNNTDKNVWVHVQGYAQLPDSGDVLFITSSMKDVLTLVALGYPAIAFQGEGYPPPVGLMDSLKSRFKNIIVWYDNDDPGVQASINLTQDWGLDYINTPKDTPKDPADFVWNIGQQELKDYVSKKLQSL